MSKLGGLLLLVAGCNHLGLENLPADLATPVQAGDLSAATPDLSAVDLSAPDLSIAPRPCTLIAAGEPFTTVQYDNPASSWHCEGLLRRSVERNHVIHYGSVSLRFGGWDDPAIIATQLDVTGWPPVVVHTPTLFFVSMHSPASLFELTGDTLGMTWSYDNDGLGPQGVEFATVDANTWTTGPNSLLTSYMGSAGTPVPLAGGTQFAINLHTPWADPTNNMMLSIVGKDGQVQSQTLLAHSSTALALGRTQSDLLAVAAFAACDKDDPAFCQAHSLVILRASSLSPLTLEKVAALPARNPKQSLLMPALLSDGANNQFLLWWEVGDSGSYLFAAPLTAAGKPSGPVEVWFTSSLPVAPGRASIGATGAVVPVALSVATDGGGEREVHLIQRQLLVDAPVSDLSFHTLPTSFAVGTVQLDDPRSLVVGYSNYPAVSGSSGFGVLSKYICAEDQ